MRFSINIIFSSASRFSENRKRDKLRDCAGLLVLDTTARDGSRKDDFHLKIKLGRVKSTSSFSCFQTPHEQHVINKPLTRR